MDKLQQSPRIHINFNSKINFKMTYNSLSQNGYINIFIYVIGHFKNINGL